MTSKFIPALTLAAMLAASGAVIVSAQTAPDEGATTAPATGAPAVETPATQAPTAAAEGTGFLGRFGWGDHDGGRGGRDGDLVRGILGQADADGDGAVTQAEIDALRTTLVGQADANGDGNLSLDEFQAVYLQLVRPEMVDAFQALDEDGDASVTAAELDARFGTMVAQGDRDGDGALSPADRGGDRDGDGQDSGHGRRG